MRAKTRWYFVPSLILCSLITYLLFLRSGTDKEIRDNDYRILELESNEAPRKTRFVGVETRENPTERLKNPVQAFEIQNAPYKVKNEIPIANLKSQKWEGTKNSKCYGLCSPKKGIPQLDYVEAAVELRLNQSIGKSINSTIEDEEAPARARQIRDWIIAGASLDDASSQPRLSFLLTLPGVKTRSASFLPELNETTDVPCRGFDRFDSELGAFYLRKTLRNFVGTDRVVGVKLNLEKDLWPIRDERLKSKTWVKEEGKYCVQFECRRCSNVVACSRDAQKPTIDGSMSFSSLKSLKTVTNPWGASCAKKGREEWREDEAFCEKILISDNSFKGKSLLDLIDVMIFDFLIDFPARNQLKYWENQQGERKFILVDNGKAFSHPNHDDLSLLSPLFQCCVIKNSTLSLLSEFSDEEYLKNEFISLMQTDRVYPFLASGHVRAASRRIKKVITVVEMCVQRYGRSVIS